MCKSTISKAVWPGLGLSSSVVLRPQVFSHRPGDDGFARNSFLHEQPLMFKALTSWPSESSQGVWNPLLCSPRDTQISWGVPAPLRWFTTSQTVDLGRPVTFVTTEAELLQVRILPYAAPPLAPSFCGFQLGSSANDRKRLKLALKRFSAPRAANYSGAKTFQTLSPDLS